MKATKFFTASALTFMLAGPAAAQIAIRAHDGEGMLTGAEFRDLFDADGIVSLAAYDTDGDGQLSEAEFDAAFADANVHWGTLGYGSTTYTDWDLNSDGLVAQDEYTQGFLVIYDRDGSGSIEGAELEQMEADFAADGIFAG
ncbi:hypothetical protein [Jannaschia rubra]|uniref:hypothetical protein n=1 Tax=Jannaschia rubra TaxID=282197 RepID=UPI002493AA30|nr:hypothetical protein [Jannaschia rubra]